MATKPVKVLSDLLTKKQIIKQDVSGNVLFNISGTLEDGYVSSSLPITASYFVGDGRYLTNISASGGTASYALTAGYAENAINSVYTTGNVTGSGLFSNPIALIDPLIINQLTVSSGISGYLYGTASFASTASYAQNSGLSIVSTSGSITGSGIVANPITLKDPLLIGAVTASLGFSGNLYGTASYANSATSSSFAITASFAESSNLATGAIQNAYNRLRYQITGNVDSSGNALVMLPATSLSGNAFPVGSVDHIAITVAIKEDSRWVNDLLSVQLYTSSTNVYVELSAPALTNTDVYKLLAVNENPSDYII